MPGLSLGPGYAPMYIYGDIVDKEPEEIAEIYVESLKLRVDDAESERNLNLSCAFTAKTDGSFQIVFFPEEDNGKYYPSSHRFPIQTVDFKKGDDQLFKAILLNVGDAFVKKQKEVEGPQLVIIAFKAETDASTDDDSYPSTTSHAIEFSIITNKSNRMELKVFKEYIWLDGIRFEWRMIPHIDEKEKNCLLCYEHPWKVIIFPCLHLGICEEYVDKSMKEGVRCPFCRELIGFFHEFSHDDNKLKHFLSKKCVFYENGSELLRYTKKN